MPGHFADEHGPSAELKGPGRCQYSAKRAESFFEIPSWEEGQLAAAQLPFFSAVIRLDPGASHVSQQSLFFKSAVLRAWTHRMAGPADRMRLDCPGLKAAASGGRICWVMFASLAVDAAAAVVAVYDDGGGAVVVVAAAAAAAGGAGAVLRWH
jgi:hypothetical protein